MVFGRNGFANICAAYCVAAGGFGQIDCDGCAVFCAGAVEDGDGQSSCTRCAGVVVGGAGQLVCAVVAGGAGQLV
jgi:hypothetical protein